MLRYQMRPESPRLSEFVAFKAIDIHIENAQMETGVAITESHWTVKAVPADPAPNIHLHPAESNLNYKGCSGRSLGALSLRLEMRTRTVLQPQRVA